MKVFIRLETNQFRKVFVHLNTQKDDIQLQLDGDNLTPVKSESAKMIELEVLMRPA